MLQVSRFNFRRIAVRVASSILLSLLFSVAGVAQTDPAAGLLPFSSQKFGVDLARGSVNLAVPMRSKLGKMPFSTQLQNTFSIWNNSGKWAANTNNMSNYYPKFLLWGAGNSSCPTGSLWNLYIMDALGTRHGVVGSVPCNPASRNQTSATTDGSGYTVVFLGSSSTIYDSSGNASTGGVAGSTPWKLSDPDGTTVQFNNVMGNAGTYTDSLSQTALTVTWVGPQSYDYAYAYTDLGGNTQKYSVETTVYNFVTAFGCSGITDGNSSKFFDFPTTIATPIGNYSLSYEQTSPGNITGRVASITYPSGGSISYGYSGGNKGITCSSGVVPTLTVTVNDNNGHSDKWTYVNSDISATPGNFTVTETDPANNQTVHNFAGEYQTQAATYQGGCPTSISGCAGGGTLSTTVTTCYGSNGGAPPVPPNCAAPTQVPKLPITETDVYSSLNGSPTRILKTIFDTHGNTTSVLAYDFGATTPTTQTFTSYGQSWNSTSGSCNPYPAGTYIYNTPCYSHIENSSGTDIARTQITYSNTGHPTSTAKWTGSSWLTSSATYNSNGTVATVTDVDSTVSTPAYNGTGGCNGLLPTSVTAGGLTTSTQWNCDGAVVTQTSDPNGQPTTYTYNDPLWRRTSMTDPLGNLTSYSYTPTTVEGAMNFNGSISTSDTLTTVDGIGRPIFAQRRQAQGSSNPFDSTQTTYGWNTTGLLTTASRPYSGTAGQAAPGGTAATTTQYDALGRPLTVTDGGGGTVSYTYPQNDVLFVLSPAPTGENNKQVQNEYDGLGRLISSCQISATVSGSTPCNQKNGSYSGVLTSTSYTSASGSQTVSSTRGSQTRSQTVDGLGRVTSATTPEGGTVTNVYDTLPSACNNRAFAYSGKLIFKGFSNGNFSCYQYDSLGRITAITGVSGSNYLCKRFFYDNSTGATGTIPSGITISYPYGRLVEAETDNCTLPITPITDEWSSYDKNGHMTDIWEKAPHSGTYYHSVATFAGNGVPLTVQLANPSLYTMTYGLDGEGRPSTLKGNSTTVVSGTTFNASSQPAYIDLGTGTDQSDYVYDPSTGRMTNWTFQVGSTGSETGTLTWNANGTLKKLAITDGFNAGGTQTCNFNPSLATGTGYDDTGRLVGIDCGSGGWGQTFSYDQYDNLTKAVISGRIGVTWNPMYSSANNRYSTGANYDNSGNLTYDTIHQYTWDQFNKLSTIDSSTCGTNGECVTYDAMGRAVETSYNSAYTEIWYTQLGKVYMTGGTTPYYAYWPTPGNGTAEVNGNAVTFYYMHKDWVGNSRISSVIVNPFVVSDQAYAPFGEVYDKLATGAGVPGQMFTGDTQDILTGIFDTPNRELNASQGRWLSPDPAGSGWNQYAYVLNPLSLTDTTGLRPGPGSPCGTYEWGGSGNCDFVVDGQEAPSWLGQGILSSGAGFQCLDSNCSGYGTQWKLNSSGQEYMLNIGSIQTFTVLDSWLNGDGGPAALLRDFSNWADLGPIDLYGLSPLALSPGPPVLWLGVDRSTWLQRAVDRGDQWWSTFEQQHSRALGYYMCLTVPDMADFGAQLHASDNSDGGEGGGGTAIWVFNVNTSRNGGQSPSGDVGGAAKLNAGAALADYAGSAIPCASKQ
jgi:RHS repeat-associated protein